jgi:bacillithiol biosynthesis deacetylase BshB1
MAVDLLVFGPHPDDIEIGLGGVVAHHVAQGFRVGLCDLTGGEMGSNGTVEERCAEAEAARAVLGAAWRENLGWPDRHIGKDPGHLDEAVSLIRLHRPRTVALPHWSDRHPDHVAASHLLTEAVFNSGLRRYRVRERGFRPKHEGEDEGNQGENRTEDAWKPEWICYYFINDAAQPSFVVDVSAHYARKWEALECHVSQFRAVEAGAVATRLNIPTFRRLIESRDAQFGAQAGVAWAEGVVVREPILRSNLLKKT